MIVKMHSIAVLKAHTGRPFLIKNRLHMVDTMSTAMTLLLT